MIHTGEAIGNCKHCGMEMRLTKGACFDCANRVERYAEETTMTALTLAQHDGLWTLRMQYVGCSHAVSSRDVRHLLRLAMRYLEKDDEHATSD